MQPARSKSNPAPWAGIIFGIIFLTIWFWTPITRTVNEWFGGTTVEVINPYSFHLQQPNLGMCLSHDGHFLATAGDRSFALWDIHSRKIVTRITLDQNIERIAYSHDGKMLIMITDNSVKLWDTQHWTIMKSFDHASFGGLGELIRLTAPTGGQLIAALTDAEHEYITIYDVIAEKALMRIGAEYRNQLTFDSSSHLFAGYSRKQSRIAVWNMTSGEQEDTIPTDEFAGTLRISPNGRYLAWSARGLVMLFDRTTKKHKTLYHDMPYRHPLTAFSPDCTRIAVSQRDGIQLYDTSSGEKVAMLSSTSSDYKSLDFSQDGKTIAANYSYESMVDIWDLSDGR
ncbi:WD40 repeat domain-containing protein [bacterium]|nr:MAG: WD40 repeat domain-containing protein [bacterium]